MLSTVYNLILLPTNLYLQSDHPVVNSRYLLHEAAQVHHYGLDPALALLSITHTPATAMGMGHRIGMLKPGM
jgi:imidazolonepropionase-like amidohydrolase